MHANRSHLLNNVTFFFFALFVFSSTFSIALSQLSFGAALLFFTIQCFVTRYNPFACRLLCVYSAIGLYLVWIGISTLVNGASLLNLKEDWLFLIIPVGLFLFRQQKFRGILIILLASGVILVSFYGIIQHFTGVNWLKNHQLASAPDGSYYAVGGFSHNLTYGNYLAVVAPFLISLFVFKLKKIFGALNWFVLFSGLMGLIGTLLSYSRTAVSALAAGLLAMSALKGKRWVIAASALLIIAATLTFLFVGQLALKFELAFKRDLAGEHDSSRLFIWQKSVEIIRDYPAFGVGKGNFETVYDAYLDSSKNETGTRPHAHNDILNFAAVFGIPGAFTYLLIWGVIFFRLHQIWHKTEVFSERKAFAGAAAVAGSVFILTSLTEATFVDEEVRQLLMVIWSAGLWPIMTNPGEIKLTQNESA